ncbi:hypothetical protein ACFSKL_05905 [Belliella marina]|uniref:SIMPL domain-containing protein n=1 Tax=Belliella marina TaxID=1644146 RepID=A0ABW4VK20_9BACT
MKRSFELAVILFVGMIFIFSSCQTTSSDSETIEMTGIGEIELPDSPYAISINFNGNEKKKEEMLALVSSGDLAKYKPKLQHENVYQEGNGGTAKNFTFSISYVLVLEDKAALNDVVSILSKNDMPGYVNTMGSYIDETKRDEYSEKLFDLALKHAENRLGKFAESKQKSYRITEILDADDPYSNAVPHDGVAYQSKLFKKVRVKAVLK